MYYWHGVRVPARIIERPESYTASEIRKMRNSEITRALAERMGWNKFTKRLGARVIDSCDIESDGEDGQHCTLHYELLDVSDHFADGQPRFLKMQSPPLKDESQPYYLDPVDPGLQTAAAARAWRNRKCDGSWPTVEECNDGWRPDWVLRHGDVNFHELPESFDVSQILELPGNVLVSGRATGHAHSLVGEATIYDAGDGMRIIHRLGDSLEVDHQEHKLASITSLKTRQSIARQYDREHGWVNVVD
jgi:hypothetical protein